MNRLLVVLFTSLLSFSEASSIYKCTNDKGEVSFQSLPCPSNTKGAEKIKDSDSRSSSTSESESESPIGFWIANSNPNLKVRLSKSGSITITDHEGTEAKGKWVDEGEGKYSIKVSFSGVSVVA